MSTTVYCPNCRESLDLPDEFLGRSVRCGACQSIFTASAETDLPVAQPNRGGNRGVNGPTRNKPIPVSRAGSDAPVEFDEEKRRRRRGRNTGLWIILGSLSFLACGCCGVLGYFVFALMNPDFTTYNSPDGRFRAKFPNEVRTATRITGRPNERAAALESSRPLLQEMFFLYHIDLTPADRAKPPAQVVQELAKGLMDLSSANGGKPQSRNPSPITHQGYDAAEVVIFLPSTSQYTQARVVVGDGRGYVIGVTGPGQPNGSPWVDEFIEAFEIVTQPAANKDAGEGKIERAPQPKPAGDDAASAKPKRNDNVADGEKPKAAVVQPNRTKETVTEPVSEPRREQAPPPRSGR